MAFHVIVADANPPQVGWVKLLIELSEDSIRGINPFLSQSFHLGAQAIVVAFDRTRPQTSLGGLTKQVRFVD